MKSLVTLVIVIPALFAQVAPKPAAVPPDTVVASTSERKVTAGELQKYVEALPGQVQRSFATNPKEFVRQFLLMEAMSKLAEKADLDKESPNKERLAWGRMQLLAETEVESIYRQIPVPEDEIKKAYERDKADRYTEAKAKVIYISFVPDPAAVSDSNGKKPATEAEAKAKAEKLVKSLRTGADFGKLAKENSEDTTSAEKNGELGSISHSSSLPEDVKKVIFALKPGQVSDPVRQPNGYYIFGTGGVVVQPYSAVRDKIFEEIKKAELNKWVENTTKNLNVKFENEAFFAELPKLPAAAPAK